MCRGVGPLHQQEAPISILELQNPKIVVPTNRSKAWFARSIAQRTAHYVEAEVESLSSSCRFLKNFQPNPDIRCLKRDEIEVGSLLGCGGFSEVYRIAKVEPESFDNQSRLVIKHLKKDLLCERKKFHQAAANLVLEAKFLASIDHPNIITIRGWAANGISSFRDGSHDGYFIILDELDETLSQRLSRWQSERITSTEIIPRYEQKLSYSSQIASALKYLHDKDIIFRDLKPDNIGFKGETVQLFDLGLCRELPESEGTNEEKFEMSGVGTRRYMAPEVSLQQGYNLYADVYSFSMVMYEMMANEKPFSLYSSEMHHLLVCIEGERPKLPPRWPENLKGLLEAGWNANPDQRPTISELYDGLRRLSLEKPKNSFFRGCQFLTSMRQRFARKSNVKFGDMTSLTQFDLSL